MDQTQQSKGVEWLEGWKMKTQLYLPTGDAFQLKDTCWLEVMSGRRYSMWVETKKKSKATVLLSDKIDFWVGRKLVVEERQRSWRNYCELNAHSQFHREALCFIQEVLSLNKGSGTQTEAGVPRGVCVAPPAEIRLPLVPGWSRCWGLQPLHPNVTSPTGSLFLVW